jgi:hypothetical protein
MLAFIGLCVVGGIAIITVAFLFFWALGLFSW